MNFKSKKIMSNICILDYGSGNTKSVYNLFESISENVIISNNISDIENSTHIVLPGVGAFGKSMEKIKEALPMKCLVKEVFENKKPFLGICVGMQVLASIGHEFQINKGLGWIDGEILKLNNDNLPLPHVGWNSVSKLKESRLLDGIANDSDFYFVHSYVFKPVNKNFIIATTIYNEDFCSVIECNNIYGVQFHPEKSHIAGKKLIDNFISIKNS